MLLAAEKTLRERRFSLPVLPDAARGLPFRPQSWNLGPSHS
jgi:hypothetical protein